MSVLITRTQLVDIARSLHVGSSGIETHLKLSLKKKPIAGFLSKIEAKLWEMIAKDHPWKDFTCGKESKTRANILQRICTVLKSKFWNKKFNEGTSYS